MAIFRKEHYSSKVVVLSLHKLGDTVHSIPAMKALVKKYHENLVILCYPENKIIYQYVFPEVEYITINHDDFLFKRISKPSVIKKLHNINPGYIYDFTGSILSATIIFWCRAVLTYGFNLTDFRCLYEKYIPVRKTPHLMDLFYDVMELDGDIYSREYKFEPADTGSRKVLIHPLAGWEAKEWGIHNFISLAGLLQSDYDCSIIIPKGSLPVDIREMMAVRKINLIETDSLKDLFFKIKECAVFISNDSGPLYIASLCGKATFTIYGPTNPLFSIPNGEQHGYIKKMVHCTPTGNNQYCYTDAGRNGCPSFICMNTLLKDEVYKEVLTFLERRFQEKTV